MVWAFSPNGEYSVKSFMQVASGTIHGESDLKHVFDDIWKGLVPPRIELLAWFAILEGLNTKQSACYVMWKRRQNMRIFESKIAVVSENWELIKVLINQWSVEKEKKLRKLKVGGMERGKNEWWWWVCTIFSQEDNKFAASGFLEDPKGDMRCLMGDKISEKSVGEAMIGCLEWSLQFMLEEVGLKEENIVFILYNKNIVDWMMGKIETSWELRMLRNRTHIVKQVIQNCGVKFMQSGEYKHRRLWEEHAAKNSFQWMCWAEDTDS
ncbi:hypothetical protein PIB30_057802 [Stylosanthes scabra]|uniref:RNase H type-1 domain-containing protein n=1 Tax=Stylosanthes scabra TaxID=79078 RepID=A0ABU6XKS6_9FABA|nr:hypothetical protein [Stylosanthes scabra]